MAVQDICWSSQRKATNLPCNIISEIYCIMEMCITDHSIMDNTIHKMWKRKNRSAETPLFPTVNARFYIFKTAKNFVIVNLMNDNSYTIVYNYF